MKLTETITKVPLYKKKSCKNPYYSVQKPILNALFEQNVSVTDH